MNIDLYNIIAAAIGAASADEAQEIHRLLNHLKAAAEYKEREGRFAARGILHAARQEREDCFVILDRGRARFNS